MRESSLIQFTLRNLGWMAASIFLAMVVWLAANMSNNPLEEREISNIPIELNLPDGYVITSQSKIRVDIVRIRAQKSEWNLLVPDDIEVKADLSDIKRVGEYRLELSANVVSPRHGKVVSIRPSTVTITVDREAEKRVPIRITHTEPPLGYSYSSEPTCDQTEVTVHGSEQKVNSVAAAEVRMDLSEQRNPVVNGTYSLTPVQENSTRITDVELDPATVLCSVDIQARSDVFQMRVLPEVINDPPEGYIFEGYVAEPETVGVSGSQEAISDMGGVVRTVPIDLTAQTGTFTAEVPLALPNGVSPVPENANIRVTVTISAVPSSRQFQEVPVEITGIDPTLYTATVLPNAVTVLVVGPEPLLPRREDLRVVVDLSGLGEGDFQVTPQGMLVDQVLSSDMTISVRPEQLSVAIVPASSTPEPTPSTPEETSMLRFHW